jgi:hypothetical protein
MKVCNCSLIFWNGVSLSCYRKTTYKDEGNNLVAAGYGYDFGDFKSYAPPELSASSDDHKKFAKLFNSGRQQIVVSRTCYDMNFTPALSRQIKLLILTADGAPTFRIWKNKVCNIKVCVSDADRGESIVLFGVRKAATENHLSPFIFDKLSCIIIQYYGEICDEVDCCCLC